MLEHAPDGYNIERTAIVAKDLSGIITVSIGDRQEPDKTHKTGTAPPEQEAPGVARPNEGSGSAPVADAAACKDVYKHPQNAADLSVKIYDECFRGQYKDNGKPRMLPVPLLNELYGLNKKGEVTIEDWSTALRTKDSKTLDVFMHARDSILTIEARGKPHEGDKNPGDSPDPSDPSKSKSEIKDQGTAFFVSKDGLMATDYHCVENGKDNLWITMPDGTQRKGKLVAQDEKQDLALVKVDLLPGEEVNALPLGNSTRFQADERLASIGKAWGKGVTVLSPAQYEGLSNQRNIETLDPAVIAENPGRTLIRTDSLVVPGDSGGPIMRLDGTVAALNVYSNSVDRMYGIPVERLKELISSYERKNKT